ncbi:unnamed protein product [Nyctereutes procyonoides]|uniref:(raccoon dog) hypothetical protein n=1 Tax=Nyctereutes procyonoides TaxID=34880 RepID=A0A811ZSA0_NYCPR|nr:unnamed protein product [Nyctereutes procyonoides]
MSFLKSFLQPELAEGLQQQQSGPAVMLHRQDLCASTLYMHKAAFEYSTMSLHAVSRDINVCPQEHLCVRKSAADEEEDSDEDLEPISKFRFVPHNKPALRAAFTAVYECQALRPDLLSPSVGGQHNMAGVWTKDTIRDKEDWMEVDTISTVAGKFEDADVDH